MMRMAIELRGPDLALVAINGLGTSLIALWPSYLASVAAFFEILVILINHHLIFMQVRKVEQIFLYL